MMEVLELEATESTPAIRFDPQSGRLEIRGRSIPENALKFYVPIIDWLKNYAASPKRPTRFDLYMEYLNSISHKMMLELLAAVKQVEAADQPLEINWFYDEDDETMLEEGLTFSQRLQVEMHMRPVASEG